MPRRARQEREVVDARAMRHRRRVDDGIVAAHVVDVDEVAGRHRLQVTLRLHHALGPAGGARGVEQPGQVVRRARLEWHGRGVQRGRVTGLARRQYLAQWRQLVAQCPQGAGQVARHEQRRGRGVTQDEGHLAWMQLGIDRHHRQSGPQRCVQRLQVGRLVAHEQGRAIARLQSQVVAQVPGQACGALGQLRIVHLRHIAQPQRVALRMHVRGPLQPLHQVHAAGSAFRCSPRSWRSPSATASISSISAATPR